MTAVSRPLAVLDSARRLGIRAMGPLARPLLGTPDARVASFAIVGLVVAFVLAVTAPAWSIGVGTVVLGVPHVISDVRYLVVRRGLARRASLYGALAIGVVGTLLGHGLRAALTGAALAVVASTGRAWRRAIVLAALGGLFALAARGPYLADLVYAHAHNLVALVVLALFARRAGLRALLVPIALFAVLAAFFLAPSAYEVLAASGAFERAPSSLPLGALADQLAPLAPPALAVRLVALFAFAQAAHYVVWLRLVPELDRDVARPRSFRQSARALVRDLSPWLVAAFAASTLVFVGWAFVDLAGARLGYLRTAFFHGYVEIVALALFACEGAPVVGPRPRGADATKDD